MFDKVFNRDSDAKCSGRYGYIDDDGEEAVTGIEMECPDHDGKIKAVGSQEEAGARIDSFLEENGYDKATIVDELN